MGNIAVPANFVRRVHDDDALLRIIRQHARDLAQDGGFANARSPQEEKAFVGAYEVLDDSNRAVNRSAYSAGEADNATTSAPNCGDAVECTFDTRSIVVAEVAYPRDDVLEVVVA